MNTWGISGPYFLLLYAALFVVAWIMVMAVRYRIRAAAGAAAVVGPPELGLYEVAMLNGGGRLALAVAACRLKEAGSIGLDPDGGTLVVQDGLPAAADPVENWLYALVKESDVPASALLYEHRAETVLGPIRDRLQELGLMLTARQTASMRWQVLWFAPLLGLGAARLVAGLANHRPVSYLVIFMLLSAGVAVTLTRLPPRKVSTSITARLLYLPRTTRAGAHVLNGWCGLPRDDLVAGSDELARRVVTGGLGAVVVADAALASTLGIRSGSGGGCGGGGCGGGGCGGGGCGGGGCGG
jgi:uncharacterized protein (TIGR04222 family)